MIVMMMASTPSLNASSRPCASPQVSLVRQHHELALEQAGPRAQALEHGVYRDAAGRPRASAARSRAHSSSSGEPAVAVKPAAIGSS